jgi:hypothetical protein
MLRNRAERPNRKPIVPGWTVSQLSTRLEERRDAPVLEEALLRSVVRRACPAGSSGEEPEVGPQGAHRLLLVWRVQVLALDLTDRQPSRALDSKTHCVGGGMMRVVLTHLSPTS